MVLDPFHPKTKSPRKRFITDMKGLIKMKGVNSLNFLCSTNILLHLQWCKINILERW